MASSFLFDGAPITHHTYGDNQIPVFPHLATRLRRNYQFFDFAGTEEESGRLAELRDALGSDIVIYPHSENMITLCATCWRDPTVDHVRHETVEKHVVTGRIAAPPDIAPARLLEIVDKAIEEEGRCQLYAPDLCAAAGQSGREEIDGLRFDLLMQS